MDRHAHLPRLPRRVDPVRTAEIDAFCTSWETVVSSTEPADRSAAEDAWAELYALADLPRPAVEWYPSPLAMELATGGDTGDTPPDLEIARESRDALGRAPYAADRLPVIRSAGSIARAMARARMGADMGMRASQRRVWYLQHSPRAADRARTEVLWTLGHVLYGPEWKRVSRWLGKANTARVHRTILTTGVTLGFPGLDWPRSPYRGRNAYAGQFDPLPPSLEVARLGGLELTPQDETRLRCWLTIGRSCGAWTSFERVVRASERPIVLALDEGGRPHHDRGPAIAFGDGMVVHAWHGVAVRDWIITEPERITISQIDEERDVEERRVLTERFGLERYVTEGHAELIHEDETGRLWVRHLPRVSARFEGRQVPDPAEPIVMVEVTNATPEPDGTRRTYFLRVPPDMQTARDAVAWTFSMAGSEYAPERQT